jgi:predicted Fe-Mo cluster-binding NifX family protein
MMIVCIPVTADGWIDPRWGRATRVVIARVERSTVAGWQEYEVAWDVLHESEAEGTFHARVAQFLREHHVETVVAHHMGADMLNMLQRMGLQVRLGAEGDARAAAVAAER